MKLNCDLGESYGAWRMGLDEQVMPYIDQANIACGFHAGDPMVMIKTIKLAKQYKVSVGAHPSYPDLVGFGRRSMQCSEQEVTAMVLYQVSAIYGVAKAQGVGLTYVKPHGALYNDMMKTFTIRKAIMSAIKQFNNAQQTKLTLMLQATADIQCHREEAADYGIGLIAEAFADRCYSDDGKLLSRSLPGAVHDKQAMLAQVKQLLTEQSVTTDTGKTLALDADSLCVHGDNETGVQLISTIRAIVDNAV
ncbi:5-oxoprolinase subunit PxpA [Litorilituus sediminis]|uniref:5-oxoprolinase subunit PxpA n=1 Tax=Litorilituus sediminis TaxID=718192 RepID=A0A4P6P1I2_9GAMM|nr:5-oxoprolinase subunit PxpA [Litorilituus sediminis]QBG34981.1 5-oxoprolinase subunit PxpA [Litorilituus sediminis]